jgi:hypothetical protein
MLLKDLRWWFLFVKASQNKIKVRVEVINRPLNREFL